MADLISSLPIDNNPLNHDEIHVLQTLFKDENKHDIQNIFVELKDSVIGGILFGLLSLPQFNTLLERFIPITKTSIIMNISIKVIIFICVYWIILNFALSHKK